MGELFYLDEARQNRKNKAAAQHPIAGPAYYSHEVRCSDDDKYADNWFRFLNLYRAQRPDLFPHYIAHENNDFLLSKRYKRRIDLTDEEQAFAEGLAVKATDEWVAFESTIVTEEIELSKLGELAVSVDHLVHLSADDSWDIPTDIQKILFQSRYQRYLPDIEVPEFID